MTYYPDFTRQIAQLKNLSEEAQDEQKQRILTKWIEQLEEIKQQVNHLKKIEQFAEIVKKD